ncbi:hypothetical protein [Bacilliculturomica massiliensis]|uniref:hypothetical protein n=1 Tax=Bacilliculturomica massiliensis TaxID=1917867 RepID=UPI00103257E4|nr:hypothetical protein [Bacilliculturomica massiliensis]
MNRTVNNMKKLIGIKFYPTAEAAYEILDAFLMANRINPDEYTDLSIMIEEKYNPVPVEPPVEPAVSEEPETPAV